MIGLLNNRRRGALQETGLVQPTWFNDLNWLITTDDVILNGDGTVNSLPDQTGNGYDFDVVGTAELENGLNSNPKLILDGADYLQNLDTYTGLDTTKRGIFIVYRLRNYTGVGSYQTIFIQGSTSFTVSGNLFMHLYKPNGTENSFLTNYFQTSLDDSYAASNLVPHLTVLSKIDFSAKTTFDNGTTQLKTGSNYAINNVNTFIGNWANNGADMEFYMAGMADNVNVILEGNKLTELQTYINLKYGI